MPHIPSQPQPETLARYMDVHHAAQTIGERQVYAHSETLGQSAIRAMIERPDAVEEAVQEMRDRLENIPTEKRNDIATILSLSELPVDLQISISGSEEPADNLTLLDALTAKNSRGAYRVSESEMLAVAAWHTTRMSQRQEAFDQGEGARLKARFSHLIATAVYADDLPGDAMKNTDDRLLFARLFVDDGLSTDADHTHGYMTRYDLDHEYKVLVSPHADKATIDHELLHVITGVEDDLFGRDKRQQHIEAGTLLMANTGLRRLFGNNPGSKLMDEAIVEHIMLSLDGGDITEVNMGHPQNQNRSYMDGGYLLEALCTLGVKPIDPRVFAYAYAVNGSRDAPSIVQLEKELLEAFPDRDVIGDIAAFAPDDDHTIGDLAYEYTKTLTKAHYLAKMHAVR